MRGNEPNELFLIKEEKKKTAVGIVAYTGRRCKPAHHVTLVTATKPSSQAANHGESETGLFYSSRWNIALSYMSVHKLLLLV